MSRQVSPSTEQVYVLQRVTRIWGIPRATIYRHRLEAVARKSGFHSEKYFGDIFQRKVGIRAGAYRKQARLRD